MDCMTEQSTSKNSSKLSDNWYVYRHIRKDKNEPFYIGIGNKPNFFRANESGKKRNDIWRRITSKSEWDVHILFTGLSKQNASEKEKEFIKIYGRIDMNTGSLSNMTDGGDGIWNCKRSEKTKKILSLGKLGSKNPMYGKKQSIELINKRRKASIGQKRSEETKQKQSISSIKSGQAKAVDVFLFKTGEFIGTFYAITEACRVLGNASWNPKACQVAKGVRNHTQGYVFKYSNNAA